MAKRDQIDAVIKRYASQEMLEIFSDERRVRLWRELWIALAEAQRELGLPITKTQIDEMKKYQDKINWDLAERKESEMRHDVMAHVHAYASQCPKAAPIIHLGATSAYVTDNADLIMMRDGLKLISGKLAAAMDCLANFAKRERNTPTVAFTHLQPAQPTTVGKRACLWIANFVMDLSYLEFQRKSLRFHSAKGATGSQDSFVKLFDGDRTKVKELDQRVMKKMEFSQSFVVTGQIYPRKVDTQIVCGLAMICESAAKFATDLRLLQALYEITEPREESQVGSSAMPYKQNPMRSERINSLSRYVIHLVGNCFSTASAQWFERSLDDSANRRIVLPHAFLITDAVLDLVINVGGGLKVNHGVINRHLERVLPFLQTEEILMAAVREGGDRQALHEIIRKHSKEVMRLVYEKGEPNDLLARLRDDPAFHNVPPKLLVRTDPSRLIGLSPEQVDLFIGDTIDPIRRKYKAHLRMRPQIRV